VRNDCIAVADGGVGVRPDGVRERSVQVTRLDEAQRERLVCDSRSHVRFGLGVLGVK